MKTIRKSIFETNSSSTHSLCIKPEDWKKYGTDYCEIPYIPITYKDELGSSWKGTKIVTITTSNYYKRGGGYYLIEGDLQKIQFIASCMSWRMNTGNTYLQPQQLEAFKAIYSTIKDYIKNNFDIENIEIKIDKNYSDGFFIEKLIGYSWDKNVKIPFSEEEIEKIVTEVISNDSIIFICHSDESGPFADDLGLNVIKNLEELL